MTAPTEIEKQPGQLFGEIGVTGLNVSGGVIQEEYYNPLRGERRFRTFREMLDHPIIDAGLKTIEMMSRQVDWRVEPAEEENAQAEEIAELVQTSLHDMSTGWEDTLAEILTFVPYGWAYHELIYKKRQGEQRQPGLTSKYTDGRIGWRKMPIRAQESLFEWQLDTDGGVKGMVQQDPNSFRRLTIPIEKALLFRTSVHKGNPEGRAYLRAAYRGYHYAKRIEEIEAIGIERDLAGLPVAEVPAAIAHPDASGPARAQYNTMKDAVVDIRRGEQAGIVLPQQYDAHGNKLYDIRLLASGGKRQIETQGILMRYYMLILMTLMTDHLLIGHEKVGSFSLSKNKTGMFSTAMGSLLDAVADVFNRHAIPRLVMANGLPLELAPKLAHDDIEAMDLDVLGTFLEKAQATGFIMPTAEDELWVRQQARMPEIDVAEREIEMEEERAREREMAEALMQNRGDSAERDTREDGQRDL